MKWDIFHSTGSNRAVILTGAKGSNRITLKLFRGTHQTMIGSEKSTEHRPRNEKICRTHRESTRSE